MQLVFQILGSASSIDLDVVFYVNQIPSIFDASRLSKEYALELSSQIKTLKPINANLAVLDMEKNVIVDVYKGTVDELNNALFYTYSLHDQIHEQQIKSTLKRNNPLKLQRCLRKSLELLSRTHLRPVVKTALRSDPKDQFELLYAVELYDVKDLGKNGSLMNYYKVLAFQLGQTLALVKDQKELYTKESIASHYTQLKPFLLREKEVDLSALQDFKQQFCEDIARLYECKMRRISKRS